MIFKKLRNHEILAVSWVWVKDVAARSGCTNKNLLKSSFLDGFSKFFRLYETKLINYNWFQKKNCENPSTFGRGRINSIFCCATAADTTLKKRIFSSKRVPKNGRFWRKISAKLPDILLPRRQHPRASVVKNLEPCDLPCLEPDGRPKG